MVRLTDINYHYKKAQPLFRQLSLALEPGNVYGLLGKNGAGKTSLLKIMAGLLFPKSGQVRVGAYRPGDRHPDFLSDLYLIPEELFLPEIAIGAYRDLYAPFYRRFDNARFEKYLASFGLNNSLKINQLSQGQKKKAITAFGLSTNARLLLLDEPTNGLDIPSKSLFRKTIAGAISDEQICVISTHQVRDMGSLMDPIIILDQGKIIFQENLQRIAERLQFEVTYSRGEPEGVYYTERVPGGYMVVRRNDDGEETEVDIEVFFNAMMSNPSDLQGLFAEADY